MRRESRGTSSFRCRRPLCYWPRERRAALDAGWSGGMGSGVFRRWARSRRRWMGDVNRIHGDFESRRRCWRCRRRSHATHAAAYAGAVVVIVRWAMVPGCRSVRRRALSSSCSEVAAMMVRGRDRRCGACTMRRTRVQHARLPDNQWEPDREQSRERAEPSFATHYYKMISREKWFQFSQRGRQQGIPPASSTCIFGSPR